MLTPHILLHLQDLHCDSLTVFPDSPGSRLVKQLEQKLSAASAKHDTAQATCHSLEEAAQQLREHQQTHESQVYTHNVVTLQQHALNLVCSMCEKKCDCDGTKGRDACLLPAYICMVLCALTVMWWCCQLHACRPDVHNVMWASPGETS